MKCTVTSREDPNRIQWNVPYAEKNELVNTLVDASASMLVLKVAAAVAEGKLEVTVTVVETRLSAVASMLSMTTVVASDAAALI